MRTDDLFVWDRKTLFDVKFVSVSRIEYSEASKPESNSAPFVRYIVHQASSVAAILYHVSSGTLYFVKQFRIPTLKQDSAALVDRGTLVEVVAGRIDKNETAREAIVREVREETGLVSKHIELIGVFYLSPGISDEKLHLFYVEIEDKPAVLRHLGNSDENIEIIPYKPSEFMIHVSNMEIFDAKTIVAAEYIRRRPDIFKLGDI